ncbi:hypothetical protein TNIN_146941 [Trichonephila inaurata madagascariensis]|uniref:Uncharacterized protein n=1 Tax=Trichonephila inaurata madagascariensis TaxID=2747483 RepID=A0A8X7C011_9ARAC|nr:hypothetical protein TNIN_146941 [Trichonephila inaurata madagascariensis]
MLDRPPTPRPLGPYGPPNFAGNDTMEKICPPFARQMVAFPFSSPFDALTCKKGFGRVEEGVGLRQPQSLDGTKGCKPCRDVR